MNRFPQIIYALFLIVFLSSCIEEKPEIIIYDITEKKIKKDFEEETIPEKSKTYVTDTTYEYEYRTGEPGNYQYHYDVFGENSQGERVTGEVDMKGKYGKGTLSDNTNIEAEWIEKGIIEAKDKSGNTFQLTVEQHKDLK